MSDVPETGDWFDTPLTPDVVRGALELERTARGVLPHRLPAWARAQNPDGQLAMAEAQPAGVRVAVRTRARTVELDVIATRTSYRGVPPRPAGLYDLLVDGVLVDRASATGGDTRTIDLQTGAVDTQAGPADTIAFRGLAASMKDVEVWLPHNESTELVGLRTDAPTEPVTAARPVWLHHGSSISHGSDAESPSSTWPAVAAARGHVELVNLGFGGGALLDPFVARTMRDTPADLISLKIGINLVNTDLMRLRALAPAVHGFLDTIREGHPTTPLLVVSPILCPIHEETPGPLAPDLTRIDEGVVGFLATGDPSDRSRLTLTVIRDELARLTAARAVDDPALHYLDGRELYGEADTADLPLPDRLHPDAATHRRIGERFAALAFGSGRPFGVGA